MKMRPSQISLLVVLCACCQREKAVDGISVDKHLQRLFQYESKSGQNYVDYGFGFISEGEAWFSDSQAKDTIDIFRYSVIQPRLSKVASYNKNRGITGCPKWILPLADGAKWILVGEMWLDYIDDEKITRKEIKRGDGEWGCGAEKWGCGECNWGVDIDVDRKNLAILSNRSGRIEIVDIQKALTLTARGLNGTRGYLDIKFSPNGKLIADNVGGLNLTDVKSKKLTELGKGQERELNAGQLDFWSDDFLVYSKRNYDYSLYKQAMAAAEEEPMGDYENESLIKDLGKETLMLLDLKDQKSRPLVTVKGRIVDIAGSDDGRRLVFVTDSHQLCVIEQKKTTGGKAGSELREISGAKVCSEKLDGGRYELCCTPVMGSTEIRRVEISPRGGYALLREKSDAVSLWRIAESSGH